MATTNWLGVADAVAQISTGSIDSVDGTPANNTYTVTIGGVAISQVGDTDVATTAAALVVLLEASTHPYFAAVTWTNPSAGNITGTADTAGVPFTAVLTETGAGTGAVTDFSDDTACTGPNFWDDAENWSEGSAPGAGDDVVIADSSVNIAWGLDQSAVTVASITIMDTYTGKIGLNYSAFATSADAATVDTSKTDYRDSHLKIIPTLLDIGEGHGLGTGTGSGRINIDCHTDAVVATVHKTANVASETGRSAVSIKLNSGTAKLHVVSATGGVFVGSRSDSPITKTTVGNIHVSAQSTSRVTVEDGTTLTTYRQDGGNCRLQCGATTVTVNGGQLTVQGDSAITTLNVHGGNVLHNGSGNISTVNLIGGLLDMTGVGAARTISTLAFSAGSFRADNDYITISAYTQPADGPYTLSVAV